MSEFRIGLERGTYENCIDFVSVIRDDSASLQLAYGLRICSGKRAIENAGLGKCRSTLQRRYFDRASRLRVCRDRVAAWYAGLGECRSTLYRSKPLILMDYCECF